MTCALWWEHAWSEGARTDACSPRQRHRHHPGPHRSRTFYNETLLIWRQQLRRKHRDRDGLAAWSENCTTVRRCDIHRRLRPHVDPQCLNPRTLRATVIISNKEEGLTSCREHHFSSRRCRFLLDLQWHKGAVGVKKVDIRMVVGKCTWRLCTVGDSDNRRNRSCSAVGARTSHLQLLAGAGTYGRWEGRRRWGVAWDAVRRYRDSVFPLRIAIRASTDCHHPAREDGSHFNRCSSISKPVPIYVRAASGRRSADELRQVCC